MIILAPEEPGGPERFVVARSVPVWLVMHLLQEGASDIELLSAFSSLSTRNLQEVRRFYECEGHRLLIDWQIREHRGHADEGIVIYSDVRWLPNCHSETLPMGQVDARVRRVVRFPLHSDAEFWYIVADSLQEFGQIEPAEHATRVADMEHNRELNAPFLEDADNYHDHRLAVASALECHSDGSAWRDVAERIRDIGSIGATPVPVVIRIRPRALVFGQLRNGIISSVRMPFETWEQHGLLLWSMSRLTAVEITDRRPQQVNCPDGELRFRWNTRSGRWRRTNDASMLPRWLFERLLGYEAQLQFAEYTTERNAMEALSRACLTWASESVHQSCPA